MSFFMPDDLTLFSGATPADSLAGPGWVRAGGAITGGVAGVGGYSGSWGVLPPRAPANPVPSTSPQVKTPKKWLRQQWKMAAQSKPVSEMFPGRYTKKEAPYPMLHGDQWPTLVSWIAGGNEGVPGDPEVEAVWSEWLPWIIGGGVGLVAVGGGVYLLTRKKGKK